MDTLNTLINTARKACGRDSDAAVAEALKVSRTTLMKWRKNEHGIGNEHLAALIALAQADPALAVRVQQERATTAAERKMFGALWDRLSPVTTVIGGLILALNMMPATSSAKPLEIKGLEEGNAAFCILCYWFAWLSHRMRQALMPPLHRRQYA